MYARVSKGMAQFVLKVEKFSHIIGTAPILVMARAYGLRPRFWLLFVYSTAVQIVDTELSKQIKLQIKHKLVRNPTWQTHKPI